MSNRTSIQRPISLEFASLRLSQARIHEEPMLDERDSFRPSEFVQRKLQVALPANHIPVSTMHSHRFVRR